MNYPDFSHVKFPPGPNDDALNRMAADLSMKLAGALDMAIKTFVNSIEGREVPNHEIMQGAKIVKLQKHATEDPEDFEQFFCWRGHAMGYRYITGSLINEDVQEAHYQATLQTLVFHPDQYPEALKLYLKDNP